MVPPGFAADETLYQGERSRVLRATRESDGQAFVLKMPVRPQSIAFRTRYRLEYEVGSLVKHPQVVQYHDVVPLMNHWVLVEENLEGRCLEDEIPDGGFETRLFLRILLQVVKGLASIHRAGVIHKGIHPRNLVYDAQTGGVKIIDFGNATRVRRETPGAVLPRRSSGRIEFMSPEQSGRMNRSLDHRSDFYSLGISAYQLLTGRLPFQASEPAELIHCHMFASAPPLTDLRPDLPPPVVRMVEKLMAKSAEERYFSARGLRRDLERFLRELRWAGHVSDFQLGEADLPAKFHLPERIYGRRPQTSAILSTFRQAAFLPSSPTKHTVMLLVSGAPGIGKSALVHELQRDLTGHRGYFVVGKCGQYLRGKPYSALAQALEAFCGHLLTESSSLLAEWRRRIDHVIGPRDQVLLDLIPSLEFVLGPRPSRPLAPRETETRLHRALIKFLRAVSLPDRPLVIFLDNLQWADQACLRLLEAMATREAVPHLFILGAFRSNEVEVDHPLTSTLDRIEAKVGSVNRLQLENLEAADLNRLLSDALSSPLSATRPLAELVHLKTDGNPLFAREFIQSLYDQGLIRFRQPKGWLWDMQGIRAQEITQDVVELVSQKIKTLPRETRGVLRWAACLGGTFRFATLAAVYERPNGPSAAAALWPAIEEGLILALDEHYLALSSASTCDDVPPTCQLGFAHDRIQQAAYFSLPVAARAALHLRIARYFTRSSRAPGDLLFEVVEHFDHGRPLLRDADERAKIAEIYLKAGRRAKSSAAYPDAVRFLRSGLELFGPASSQSHPDSSQSHPDLWQSHPDSWQSHPDLWRRHPRIAFDFHREILESLVLSTRFDEADELFEFLFPHCRNVDEQMDLYLLHMDGLLVQGRTVDAIEAARQSLVLLGQTMPTQESCNQDLDEELATMEELIGERQIEELVSIPKIHDPELSILMRVLSNISSAAYGRGRADLLAWSATRQVNLSIKYGHNEMAAMNYARFAVATAIPMQRDYHAALAFGALAMRLLGAQSTNDWTRARALTLYAGGILPWHRPLKHSVEPLQEALGICLDCGDLAFSNYSLWFMLSGRFFSGEPLDELAAETEKQLGYLERSYATRLRDQIRAGLLQPIAALAGKTRSPESFDDAHFNETAYLESIAESRYALAIYFASKIRQLYLFDATAEAVELLDRLPEIRRAIPTQPLLADAILFSSLAITRHWPEGKDSEQREWARLLDQNDSLLGHWAEACSANFSHMKWLVEAEQARISGELQPAMELYQKAAAATEQHGLLQYRALALELYGRFWLEVGDSKAANIYLYSAQNLYSEWGAVAKVEQFQQLYPDLAPPITSDGDSNSDGLDLDGILKGCQAISKEVRLERLLQTLLAVAIEHAAADRGVLLTARDGRLVVEAEVCSAEALPVVNEPIPLEHYHEICRSAALYVFRTGDEVVLGDAMTGEQFATDPRILGGKLRSLLCLPMQSHGETRGVLYLENTTTAHAFTEARLSALRILLGQSAISLENAHLYESLTREITERAQTEDRLKSYTTELESKNAELERFSYTVSHDLKSPLVTIKGFLGLLKEDAAEGDREAMDADIQRIGDAADRMHDLLSDLLELSRVGRLVNPPVEFCLRELVQETVDLLAGPIHQSGAEVIVSPGLPHVRADRLRLGEVIQNLVENAIKFMGDQPDPRVEIGWLAEADPVYFVRDNGIGIDSQHQKVIFGLFEQLDQRKEGTGVGLALVRRIVGVHGGQLWIESEGEGMGSTFCFTLGAEKPSPG